MFFSLHNRFQGGNLRLPHSKIVRLGTSAADIQYLCTLCMQRAHRGTTEVPQRYHRDTTEDRGTTEEPQRYHRGTAGVPQRYRRGTAEVPQRYRRGTTEVQSCKRHTALTLTLKPVSPGSTLLSGRTT